MVKRYTTPFAEAGDKVDVPNAASTNVNYSTGYGSLYQADPETDPDAKFPERSQFNQLFNDATGNIKQWQEQAFPNFFSATENGGSALSYDKGVIVKYTDGLNYISLFDDNTTEPTSTSWEVYNGANIRILARALGVTDEDVIYKTDTASEIPKFIFDQLEQYVYMVPDAAQGKYIDSVVDDLLTTTDTATYTLESSILNRTLGVAGDGGFLSFTVAEIEAALGSAITPVVENYLKANQNCNVPSSGVDLPDGTPRDYTAGDMIAYNFEAVTDIIGMTKIGDTLDATSGTYRRKYAGDFSSAFSATQLSDGSTSQTGVAVTYDATSNETWLDVEFGVAPAHDIAVLAPSVGKVAVINDSDSAKNTHVIVDFGYISNGQVLLTDNPYGNENDTNCHSRVQLSVTGADGTWFTTGQTSQTSNISGWIGIISEVNESGLNVVTAAGSLTIGGQNIGGLTTRSVAALTSAYCRVIVYYQGDK